MHVVLENAGVNGPFQYCANQFMESLSEHEIDQKKFFLPMVIPSK